MSCGSIYTYVLLHFRQADLIDISNATDIHDTKFDLPQNPVSPNGVLDSSITPAEYVPFVNYLDPIQLARFGLHNGMSPFCYHVCAFITHACLTGGAFDESLIDSKWESLALAPVGDPTFPNDYFLFTAVRSLHVFFSTIFRLRYVCPVRQ